MTFLLDDEQALCRYLAAKAWTSEYMTEDDKALQGKLRRQNAESVSRNFEEILNEAKLNKCKTGETVRRLR